MNLQSVPESHDIPFTVTSTDPDFTSPPASLRYAAPAPKATSNDTDVSSMQTDLLDPDPTLVAAIPAAADSDSFISPDKAIASRRGSGPPPSTPRRSDAKRVKLDFYRSTPARSGAEPSRSAGPSSTGLLPGTEDPVVPSGPRPLTETGRRHPQSTSYYPGCHVGVLRAPLRRGSLQDDQLPVGDRTFSEFSVVIADCISEHCRALRTNSIADVGEIEMKTSELP